MRPIDIEIIDDFVSPSYLKELNESVDPNEQYYHFQGSQSFFNNDIEDFGFSIGLCSVQKPDTFYDTKLATFVRPLIYQIKDYAEASSIVRCRVDLTLLHKQKYIHPPHIDIHNPQRIQYVAAIVYVNETDGDTVIYDHQQDEISPYPTSMKIKKTITFFDLSFHFIIIEGLQYFMDLPPFLIKP